MRRIPLKGGFWLNFFSCFLIPGYTLWFAGSVAWFRTNFSVIAVTGVDNYRGFIYWGILLGSYFLVMLTRLALVLPRFWQRLSLHLITLGACLSLAYALAIPYPSGLLSQICHAPRAAGCPGQCAFDGCSAAVPAVAAAGGA